MADQLINQVVDISAVDKQLGHLSDYIDTIDKQITELNTKGKSIEAKVASPKSFSEFNKTVAEGAMVIDRFNGKSTELMNVSLKLQKVKTEEARTTKINTETRIKETQATDRATKATAELTSEYKRQSKEAAAATLKARDYYVTLGAGHPKTIQAIADAQALNNQLKSADAATGSYTRNVGNYGSALSKAWGFIRQAAYILPGLGIAGVFNYIGEAVGWAAEKFGLFGTAMTEAEKASRAYDDSLRQITVTTKAAAVVEVARMENLVRIAADEKASYDGRIAAIQSLQKEWPQYFAGLSQEAFLHGEVAKQANLAAKAIYAQAISEAAGKKFSSVATEYSNTIEQIQDIKDEMQSLDHQFNIKRISDLRAAIHGVDILKANEQQKKQISELITLQDALGNAGRSALSKYEQLDRSLIPLEVKRVELLQKGYKYTQEQSKAIQDFADATKATEPAGRTIVKIEADLHAVTEQLNHVVIGTKAYNDLLAKQKALQKELRDAQGKETGGRPHDFTNEVLKSEADQTKGIYDEAVKRAQLLAEIQKHTSEDDKKNLNERLDAYHNYSQYLIAAAYLQAQAEEDIINQQLHKIDEIKRKAADKQTIEEKVLLLKEEVLNQQLLNIRLTYAVAKQRIDDDDTKHRQDALDKQRSFETQNVSGLTTFIKKEQDAREEAEDKERKHALDKLKEYQQKRTALIKKAEDEIIKAIFAAGSQYYENRLSFLDEEKTAIERNRDLALASIDAENVSDDERRKKKAAITAQAIRDEKELDQRRRKIQQDQAKFQKAASIAAIIQSTAEAVVAALGSKPYTPANIGLAALTGAIGAAELGIALATPIPAFAKGTKSSPEGLALVGEAGAEIGISDGKAKLYTKPTIDYLKKGTEILTAEQTQRVLNMYGGMQALQSASWSGQNIEQAQYATGKHLGSKLDQTNKLLRTLTKNNSGSVNWSRRF